MAPASDTEDYYMVLEVAQTATPELVIRSYRRLALKLHPDRNAKHDATEAFQLLGRAYETLKDESKRRAYDLIYPSISRCRSFPQTTQTPCPPPSSTSQSKPFSNAAQIAALQKSKQERGTRWWTKKTAFDSSIFELQRDISRVEQEIKNLDSVAAAEAAEEAQKNSWGIWLLSPIYKKVEDSAEKARKDRERQERRIEKDMKERRLGVKKADLEKEERLLRKAKEEVDDANLVDNGKIRMIQEMEKMERERMERIWNHQQKLWEKREREAAEGLRKQRVQERAAEQKRQEEPARKRQKITDDDLKKGWDQYYPHLAENYFAAHGWTRQASTPSCRHDSWWAQVQGCTACPKCYDIWTYLLQCPGCGMKACPKCQGAIRERIPCNAAWTNRRVPPSMDSFFDY